MSSITGAEFEAEMPLGSGSASREQDLMQRARSGDRAAYGQVVMGCQDRLFNAVLRMVGDYDEARELTQETFLKALDKISSFRGDASAYTWLFRIAMNLTISRLRQVQRRRTFSLDSDPQSAALHGGQAAGLVNRLVSPGTGPSERVEKRERNQQVLAALGRLDAEYRAVLVMRDIEGFDYQQMAEVLGIPLGTLKSRLFRARLALRDELRSYFQPPGGEGKPMRSGDE